MRLCTLLSLGMLVTAAAAQETAGAPPDALELILAKHLAEASCEDPGSEHMRQHQGIAADAGPTSVVYAIPCAAGSDNVSYRLYAHETGEIGGVTTLYFATFSDATGWTGTDLLHNIALDGPKLTARFRHGPTGACGTLAEWTWIDYTYRLDRFAVQEPCLGGEPPQWRTVYPASTPLRN